MRTPILFAGITLGSFAHAADTIETWDAGATDVELYMSGSASPQSWGGSGEMVLGYGVTDGLSAYTCAQIEADGGLSGARGFGFGVFGTPLDTNAVDIDLLLDLSSTDDQGIAITPAIELNLDHDPDMRSWGLFLLAALPVANEDDRPALRPELSGGLYRTVGDDLQIFVASTMGMGPLPLTTLNGIAANLGCNILISDSLELISELQIGLPGPDRDPSAGVVLGFVGTVPG